MTDELRSMLERIRALALAGDFSEDDLGGDIGTITLRNPKRLFSRIAAAAKWTIRLRGYSS